MHGGKRAGAGRSRIYGAKTKAIRVPEHLVENIQNFIRKKLPLPFYQSGVSAGSPFPGEDNIEDSLDISEYLVQNPKNTFLARASGDSMLDAGIFDGDLLVVDRLLAPVHGKIIVANIDGGLTVKRLIIDGGVQYLKPENKEHSIIKVTEESDMHIWGVVTSVIHQM
jgi:DNA polymerase V